MGARGPGGRKARSSSAQISTGALNAMLEALEEVAQW
jgi:hypothetical protein